MNKDKPFCFVLLNHKYKYHHPFSRTTQQQYMQFFLKKCPILQYIRLNINNDAPVIFIDSSILEIWNKFFISNRQLSVDVVKAPSYHILILRITQFQIEP